MTFFVSQKGCRRCDRGTPRLARSLHGRSACGCGVHVPASFPCAWCDRVPFCWFPARRSRFCDEDIFDTQNAQVVHCHWPIMVKGHERVKATKGYSVW